MGGVATKKNLEPCRLAFEVRAGVVVREKNPEPRRLAFGARVGGVVLETSQEPLRLAFGAREGLVTRREPPSRTWSEGGVWLEERLLVKVNDVGKRK